MSVRYTKHFLGKLEDLFSESDYILRYEKGSFQSGYCILNETKVAIVNKYFSLEGKINSLMEILKQIQINEKQLSAKNKALLGELRQNQLQV